MNSISFSSNNFAKFVVTGNRPNEQHEIRVPSNQIYIEKKLPDGYRRNGSSVINTFDKCLYGSNLNKPGQLGYTTLKPDEIEEKIKNGEKIDLTI